LLASLLARDGAANTVSWNEGDHLRHFLKSEAALLGSLLARDSVSLSAGPCLPHGAISVEIVVPIKLRSAFVSAGNNKKGKVIPTIGIACGTFRSDSEPSIQLFVGLTSRLLIATAPKLFKISNMDGHPIQPTATAPVQSFTELEHGSNTAKPDNKEQPWKKYLDLIGQENLDAEVKGDKYNVAQGFHDHGTK
jgi:hypothetical protein